MERPPVMATGSLTQLTVIYCILSIRGKSINLVNHHCNSDLTPFHILV